MNISAVGYRPLSVKRLNFTGEQGEFSRPSIDKKGMSIFDYEKLYSEKFADSLNERKKELYSVLDSAKLDDDTTFTDKIAGMFDMSNKKYDILPFFPPFYHNTMKENADEIIKNGFNISKINRTDYGPGIYFGISQGALSIYSGETLKAEYKGKIAVGKRLNEYNSINSIGISKLRKHLNIPLDFNQPMATHEQEVLRKFVNEYVRNYIVEKLGIDGAEAVGSEGYFVVFNLKSITKIERYGQDF